jgi:hypothetical protein
VCLETKPEVCNKMEEEIIYEDFGYRVQLNRKLRLLPSSYMVLKKKKILLKEKKNTR